MMYILDENQNPVPEPDAVKWGRWFENTDNRRVAFDEVGDVHVSTTFMGLGGFGLHLLLWETMIFGGDYNDYQVRYATRQAAVEGHELALALVRQSEKQEQKQEKGAEWIESLTRTARRRL
jgi:hypothetical protein